jgi:hypothetical protein
MTNSLKEDRSPHLWLIYGLFLLVAAASCSGRIFSVLRDKETPFLSANDRSRWCMIRALVDDGTFVIDDIIFNEKQEKIKGWHTIDLVKHRGADGKEHYHSSKPVFMPTLMAGVYGVVKFATGKTLHEDPFFVGKTVLWLCNVPPLLWMFYLLIRLIDRYAADDWTRLIGVAATTWGTFLTTYVIALNNHLHAAVCVVAAVYFFLEIVEQNKQTWLNYFACGLFAALVFANELPGLAFLALFAAVLLVYNWRQTLTAFAPASVAIVIAMVMLNYIAHNSWRPPYAHRKDGPVVPLQSDTIKDLAALRSGDASELSTLVKGISPEAKLIPRMKVNPTDDVTDRWALWDEANQLRFAVRLVDSSGKIEVREWDNWYEYEGTNWETGTKQGVDKGEPTYLMYAVHCLIGHHGLFSLTPLWIFSAIGMVYLTARAPTGMRMLGTGTLLLSVVCLAFYLSRPLHDRNYGGVCNGLRWMMWFIPLYLITMLPVISWLGRTKWGRICVYVALAVSIFSAAYKPANCFNHPWLFDLLSHFKVISYP